MKNSSHTGRFARDMESAFGPYQRSSQCEIVPMDDERDGPTAADFALYIVAVIAICVVVKFGDAPEPTNNQPAAQVAAKE